MDTKIVRLLGSTRVETKFYPTLRRVLNDFENFAPIRFYMGVKQVVGMTLKGFIGVLRET